MMYFRSSCKNATNWRLLTVLMMASLLAACSFVEAKLAGGDKQRAAISRSVKAELVKSPAVDAAPLRVHVSGDTIVLKGFVESLEESQAAESVAHELYPSFIILNTISIR